MFCCLCIFYFVTHRCATHDLLLTWQGLVLSTAAREQLAEDMNPMGFKFVLSDIQEIRPIVRVRFELERVVFVSCVINYT